MGKDCLSVMKDEEMLISVVMTYPYGAKSALINAHKNNYITTAIFSCGGLLQYILQIFVLLLTRSFEWYLICRGISALAQRGGKQALYFVFRSASKNQSLCEIEDFRFAAD